jgi:hypothetical protein
MTGAAWRGWFYEHDESLGFGGLSIEEVLTKYQNYFYLKMLKYLMLV